MKNISLAKLLLEDDKPYGDYLFLGKTSKKFDDPEWFALAQGKSIGSEEDTYHESELANLLSKWVNSNSVTSVAPSLYAQLPMIKKASAQFGEFLKPNKVKGSTVYRGITRISNSTIEQLKKTTKPKDWLQQHDMAFQMYLLKKIPYDYVPNNEVQSWTTSFNNALEFSDAGMLIGKVDSNFYMHPDTLASIYGSDENEILHFGKKYDYPVHLMVSPEVYKRIFDSNISSK